MQSPPYRSLSVVITLLLFAAPLPAFAKLPAPEVRREWIQAMKASPKGPFARIRWFCADGTVHPPKPYPCEERGGGIQHGEWNDHALALREGGYQIANVLGDLQGEAYVGDSADLVGLKQILLERFLMGFDDGWIFDRALSYRGAFQIEDELAGADRILQAIAADPAWRTPARFYLLREAVRLLPRETETGLAQEIRELAVVVAEQDPGFASLRAKIHNAPQAADAASVRSHAEAKGVPAAKEQYARLAQAIDELYSAKGGVQNLRTLADRAQAAEQEGLAQLLREQADALEAAEGAAGRFEEANRMLAEYRVRVGATTDPVRGMLLLEASLAMEDEAFAAGNLLAGELAGASRRQRLGYLMTSARGLYGAGLISERQLRGIETTGSRLRRDPELTLDEYRRALRYLARAPEWADRWVRFHFGVQVERWATLDPLSHIYPQDRLRGSPLLFYGVLVDGLTNDANQLAGIEHSLFGARAGAGLRALNPGMARGVLAVPEGSGHDIAYRRDGIYLLPETISELPPVSGILTRGEGSSLSHVQLLARNLGIPNVVVRESLLPTVQENLGKAVVLAVSPGGVVQLEADGPQWDAVFGNEAEAEAAAEIVIRPDLEKLDLSVTNLVGLSELRATDSGRISGPKGANLGELRHNFGAQVPNGFVIPFGVFRQVLERPIEAGGPSVWDWMRARYALIAKLADRPDAQKRVVNEFLTRLRTWIEKVDLSGDFEAQLRAKLTETFGLDGSYGVFVRSDTNVEDLAGFTGAGLNKTIANVVGASNILAAVREVWASPFSERAYSWRQSHMESPEYVFPAVVVQLGFPAEKSGVMVTADVDTGSRDWLSVAVNEGVGGAVDGQATESLAVRADGQEVIFLAQATAPLRTELAPKGGVVRRSSSGSEEILTEPEIAQLVELARRAPSQFPSLREEGDKPADIEFAFKDGQLALLQLRPFVESKAARGNSHLQAMDRKIQGSGIVDLGGIPRGGAQ